MSKCYFCLWILVFFFFFDTKIGQFTLVWLSRKGAKGKPSEIMMNSNHLRCYNPCHINGLKCASWKRATNRCKIFRFWNFWEHFLYEILQVCFWSAGVISVFKCLQFGKPVKVLRSIITIVCSQKVVHPVTSKIGQIKKLSCFSKPWRCTKMIGTKCLSMLVVVHRMSASCNSCAYP